MHCQEQKKRLNRIVLGLELVERKSDRPKFLSNPNSYLAIQGWVGAYRRPKLKQQKTLTETLSSLGLLGRSSEVEHNINMSISFFHDSGGLFPHFSQLLLLGLHSRSSEVECNPKMSISFFDDLGPLFHILVNFYPSDRSTDYQKLIGNECLFCTVFIVLFTNKSFLSYVLFKNQ